MKRFAVYDEKTGKIILLIKSTGQRPDNSIEIAFDEVEGGEPIDKTYKVNLQTKKLEKKDKISATT